MLFLDVVVPVAAILAAGFAFGRYTIADLRPLSQVTLYVLSPALVFGYLASAEIAVGEFGRMLAYSLLYLLAGTGLTAAAARLAGRRRLLSPLLLASVFPNSGNYGLPVALFAYGEAGFLRGVTVLAIHLVLMYSVGVYFASLHQAPDWRKALGIAIRTPPVFAALAAGAIRILTVPVPEFVMKPVRLVGDASVPIVLLLLGMQLARTRVTGDARAILLGTGLRLVAGPLLAATLVYPLGITGTTAKVLVLQHAMPTAALMTVFAVEYGARPDLVASVTVVTTAASFAIVTAILYWLEWAF